MGYSPVEDAVAALCAGGAVLVETPSGGAVVARSGHVLLGQLGTHRRVTQRAALTDLGGTLRRLDGDSVALDLLRMTEAEMVAVSDIADVGGVPLASYLARLAADHDLPLVDAADIAHHRWRTERLVERVATADLPLPQGAFVAHAFRSFVTGAEHIALVLGDVVSESPVLCRVHSECVTGDALGSLRCDCGEQLDGALTAIGGAGRGVLVYLRGHEGRGIGLAEKLRAYELQERGHDTYDANVALGHPPDAREFADAAQVLRALDVGSVRLLTNNPAKLARLESLGVAVEDRVALAVEPNPHNAAYLDAKRRRFGHL